MKIHVSDSAESLGIAAAAEAAKTLREAIKKNGEARMVVSTGASQFTTFAALVNEDVDWSKVEMFHLDEYIGLDPSHPASFIKYLKERFVSKVNLKAAHFVDLSHGIANIIKTLTSELEKAPIDLALIGIGENAHIAFNDPPADFDCDDAFMVVTLDADCRNQQFGEGWFPTTDDVPKHAISMTVRRIMKCKKIISSVPYAVKARAIEATLNGEISNNIPATILRTHPDWTLFLDKDSASLADIPNTAVKMRSYAFAGASGRGLHSYALPMRDFYSDCADLKAVFDINIGRAKAFAKKCGKLAVYDDFDEMIRAQKPDCVIITTVDAYHSDYVVRALELGCDVIVEKPITIDAQKMAAIFEAENKYGKKVRTIFNMRYTPYVTKLKEIMVSGAIGSVYSVHLEWMLDRVMALSGHGASYYRRWNARMAKSGGLLLHKSSHHFDMVNWLVDSSPKKVSAFGKLNLYGKNGKLRGKNCRDCIYGEQCEFFYKLSDFEIEFYAEQERYDGYSKDGCVFAEDIDIYDTMSLSVEYESGAIMSYSLNATAAYEGWRMSINGSKGRIEAIHPSSGFQSKDSADYIRVYDLADNMTEYRVSKIHGSHGGSDSLLLMDLMHGSLPDPLGRAAGTKAGADAILLGAAANVSIKTGKIVDIDELLKSETPTILS